MYFVASKLETKLLNFEKELKYGNELMSCKIYYDRKII